MEAVDLREGEDGAWLSMQSDRNVLARLAVEMEGKLSAGNSPLGLPRRPYGSLRSAKSGRIVSSQAAGESYKPILEGRHQDTGVLSCRVNCIPLHGSCSYETGASLVWTAKP